MTPRPSSSSSSTAVEASLAVVQRLLSVWPRAHQAAATYGTPSIRLFVAAVLQLSGADSTCSAGSDPSRLIAGIATGLVV